MVGNVEVMYLETNTQDGWPRVMRWLVQEWHWPAASLFAACLLLLLAPAWLSVAGPALTLVYLQLPVYMLHQWEEHTGDRFRQYINQRLAGGREALTPTATFWINVIGVWAVDLDKIVRRYLSIGGRSAGNAIGGRPTLLSVFGIRFVKLRICHCAPA